MKRIVMQLMRSIVTVIVVGTMAVMMDSAFGPTVRDMRTGSTFHVLESCGKLFP